MLLSCNANAHSKELGAQLSPCRSVGPQYYSQRMGLAIALSRNCWCSPQFSQHSNFILRLAKQAFKYDIEEFVKDCLGAAFEGNTWGFADPDQIRKLLVDR